jgi:hypothetical protein
MIIRLSLALLGLTAAFACDPARAAPDRSCFARSLPAEVRDSRVDDVKFLLGWAFDVAAAHKPLAAGEEIDKASGLSDVPGFGGATDLSALRGRYRVIRAPLDAGNGYYGIELAALDETGAAEGLYLLNRLFRMPVLLQEPIGFATDIVTNGAMLFGGGTDAIEDLKRAADTAFADAAAMRLPLLTVGQSQAGGEAQLQAAYLAETHPGSDSRVGFVTFNAARVTLSVRHLGLAPDAVEGINFVKDLDPGFGPHGILPNEIGLQVYIHPDGTGGASAGDQSFFAAAAHPGEHLLNRFDPVSLAAALRDSLASLPSRCDGLASPP